MNIVKINNARPGNVEVFLAQPSAQTVPGSDSLLLDPALTLPVTNSAEEFGQHSEDAPRFACIRCNAHIHEHAIRFWRSLNSDGTETIWYLAPPHLEDYAEKVSLSMKPPVGTNPIHLKIYSKDEQANAADKMIGIVGEMVSDIIFGDEG